MITSPSDYLTEDSRYKAWGRLTSARRVNLAEKGGYALGGEWVKFHDRVAVGDGEFLICAADTGSRKNHSYRYRLIDCHGQRVMEDARKATIAEALAAGKVTEKQAAEAENSVLYSYALYISLSE